MTVNIYTTSDDNRTVNKTLTAIKSNIPILPTKSIDIVSPNFVINNDNTVYSANYLYCDTFQRYYYINNITLDTGGRMILHCSIDVLKTYAAYIPNINATVVRSESIGAPTAIPDKMLPIDPNRFEYKSILFNKSFTLDPNNKNFLLITR